MDWRRAVARRRDGSGRRPGGDAEEAMDDLRRELARARRDIDEMRASLEALYGFRQTDAAAWRRTEETVAHHGRMLAAICSQIRNALFETMRELVRLVRRAATNHESRIRTIERRLFGSRRETIH